MGVLFRKEIMNRKVKKVEVKKAEVKPKMYKDYDIKWLREIPEHPDYKLVAEYDEKFGKEK